MELVHFCSYGPGTDVIYSREVVLLVFLSAILYKTAAVLRKKDMTMRSLEAASAQAMIAAFLFMNAVYSQWLRPCLQPPPLESLRLGSETDEFGMLFVLTVAFFAIIHQL